MSKTNAIVSLVALALFILSGCGSEKASQDKQKVATEKEKVVEQKPVVMFFGNSITAGYGLDMDQAFPAIIQRKMDSLGYNYQVVNAGLSGETTAAGVNRIDWVLRTVPDIFVLELGANDGLRGLKLTETKKNLQKIMDRVREVNPEVKILLTGMEVPPNLGGDYAAQFRELFAELAQENDVAFLAFILEGVAGNPSLNLADGIHPTPEGHLIVADLVWTALKPLLEKPSS
ncbi:MAG: arylesterase [Cyclobacteriaceae bacterium]